MNHFKKEIKKKNFAKCPKTLSPLLPRGRLGQDVYVPLVFCSSYKKGKKKEKKIEEISSVRLWENQMASIRTDVAPLSFFLSCSLRDFVRATSFSIDGGVSTARPPL